jgi:hypothetical protein
MGEVLDMGRKAIGLGCFACCFCLALSSGVAIFTLFQCFPSILTSHHFLQEFKEQDFIA